MCIEGMCLLIPLVLMQAINVSKDYYSVDATLLDVDLHNRFLTWHYEKLRQK